MLLLFIPKICFYFNETLSCSLSERYSVIRILFENILFCLLLFFINQYWGHFFLTWIYPQSYIHAKLSPKHDNSFKLLHYGEAKFVKFCKKAISLSNFSVFFVLFFSLYAFLSLLYFFTCCVTDLHRAIIKYLFKTVLYMAIIDIWL